MAKNPQKQTRQDMRKQYGTANPRAIAKQITYEQLGKFQKDPSQFGMTESDRQRAKRRQHSKQGWLVRQQDRVDSRLVTCSRRHVK